MSGRVRWLGSDLELAGNTMITVTKRPPIVEDLHHHSQEQIAELRRLLASCARSRPDLRRPGFFEIEGPSDVFYVFKYPTGEKVLLLGMWERDPVAELATLSCTAA